MTRPALTRFRTMESAVMCRRVMDNLGAFLDGELSGRERLAVAEHLRQCEACTAEHGALSDLGHALRLESEFSQTPADLLGGLVGSVRSRITAEQSLSWQAIWNKAFDDWHWAAVGLGSVTGALASIAVAAAMMSSSIAQLAQMNPSAGTLYLMALPDDGRGRPVMMEFDDRLGGRSTDTRRAVPASIGWEAERALVAALDETLIRSGRPASLKDLPRADRENILALLSEISDLRYQSVQRFGGRKNVVGVHLAIDTFVRASGP